MKMSTEELVAHIMPAIVKELTAMGFTVSPSTENTYDPLQTAVIDMSAYRSPVLTEQMIMQLSDRIQQVIVPQHTVLTPRAKERVRLRRITIAFSHCGRIITHR